MDGWLGGVNCEILMKKLRYGVLVNYRWDKMTIVYSLSFLNLMVVVRRQ
jgi:hypothetical protein